MVQALRAIVFYVMLGGGALYLATSPVAALSLWGGAWAWNYYLMRHSDHDMLAALLFFLFVISLIGSFFMALLGY